MILIVVSLSCSAAKISDMPFDSTFHLGMTSGLGAGINFGLSLDVPIMDNSYIIELEQIVANTNYEQNISVTKLGLQFYRHRLSQDLYLTFHGGLASFFVPLATSYSDFFSGRTYNIPDSYNGRLFYWGVGFNLSAGEYIITPKFSLNTIADGGTLMELNINIGHKI